jgi:diacylglycerol kinase (ATP)
MRAAVILGLGTSPAALKPFQSNSSTKWIQGLPSASTDADAILIFGGDGTIHRHLPALVRLQLPVLIVPAGSGNDFARALKLRSMRDSLRVWRDFVAGKIQARPVDLGVIIPCSAPESALESAPENASESASASTSERKHFFCTVAGCGLDAIATRRANKMPRWLRAHGGYALSLLPMLSNLPAFPMQLTKFNAMQSSDNRDNHNQNDDRNVETGKLTLLAAFANTQFYGDGMRIAPQADFADGKLDICRISTMNPFKLFCAFPTVYFGHHLRLSEVEYSRADGVQLRTETPLDIYADGEFVCQTPVEISASTGVLRVICSPQ